MLMLLNSMSLISALGLFAQIFFLPLPAPRPAAAPSINHKISHENNHGIQDKDIEEIRMYLDAIQAIERSA